MFIVQLVGSCADVIVFSDSSIESVIAFIHANPPVAIGGPDALTVGPLATAAGVYPSDTHMWIHGYRITQIVHGYPVKCTDTFWDDDWTDIEEDDMLLAREAVWTYDERERLRDWANS